MRELARSAEEDPSQRDAAAQALRDELPGEDAADARGAIGSDFAAAPGSLFSPELSGVSTYKIEGARLTGMSTAILTDKSGARVALD